MTDTDDKNISNEYLVDVVEKIISNIKKNIYDEDIKNDIYDCMQYFTTGNKNVNPELVKYLFIGWYIHSLIEKEPKNC